MEFFKVAHLHTVTKLKEKTSTVLASGVELRGKRFDHSVKIVKIQSFSSFHIGTKQNQRETGHEAGSSTPQVSALTTGYSG